MNIPACRIPASSEVFSTLNMAEACLVPEYAADESFVSVEHWNTEGHSPPTTCHVASDYGCCSGVAGRRLLCQVTGKTSLARNKQKTKVAKDARPSSQSNTKPFNRSGESHALKNKPQTAMPFAEAHV